MTGAMPEEALARLRRAVEGFARQAAIAGDHAGWAATRTVTGTAGYGHIVVTATGDGQIHSVRISPLALAGTDRQALAAQVVMAVNEALDRAEQLAVPAGRPAPDDLGQAMVGYESRVDGLLDRLTAIERALRRPDR